MTREPWPLDGMKFDTLKELHAKRNPEDLEIDYGMATLASVHLVFPELINDYKVVQ